MPLAIRKPEAVRRHALVIAAERNQPGWPNIAEAVKKERLRAHHLFLEVLHYEQSTYQEIIDPDLSLVLKVRKWIQSVSQTPNDFTTVYYTGHGVERAQELHLITTDIEVNDESTAVTASTLAKQLLETQHALLILDTCASGAAQFDVPAVWTRFREAEGGSARSADFHVVTAARSVEKATVGRFIDALEQVLAEGIACSADTEYAALENVIGEVNKRFRSAAAEQHASYSSSGESGTCFLPNPKWNPRLRVDLPSAQAASALFRIQELALRTHWLPRARGVSVEGGQDWFFSGRSEALHAIITWIKDKRAPRGFVVTGQPGSGKSALLARIAILADPAWSSQAVKADKDRGVDVELPPPSCIDVAIHARGKDERELLLEFAFSLSPQLDSSSSQPNQIVDQVLKERKERTLLLVDALDEALRPIACAQLLRHLAEMGVFIIVSARDGGATSDSLISQLGKQFLSLNIDSDQYRSSEDVSRFVERCLRAWPGSPYAAADQTDTSIREIAQEVSRRADKSFLVASMTVRALVLRTQRVEAKNLEELPETVSQAFQLDLDRYPVYEQRRLKFVLGALAFAQGSGLPQELWYPVVKSLAGDDLTRSDIDYWSREASFYIVSSYEFGKPVRRLYHEAFAVYIKNVVVEQLSVGDFANVHARIAHAIGETVPVDASETACIWQTDSLYILTYYPRHLQQAGLIQELVNLVCDARWIEAKKNRFSDFTPFLDDLTLAVASARAADPPDVKTLFRPVVTYARFIGNPPPIVLDVLAGLGQLGRAQLMAGNIEKPLDRCHALCLIAKRCVAAGQSRIASELIREAFKSATLTETQFQSMAYYWLIGAAIAAGNTTLVTSTRNALHNQLKQIRSDAAPPNGVSRESRSGLWSWLFRAFTPSEPKDRVAVLEKEWSLPHWLFWTAMALRQLCDESGLGEVRGALQGTIRKGKNLDSQAAAVAGDTIYLGRAAEALAVPSEDFILSKPGNVALALVEAGMKDKFDELLAANAFNVGQPADAQKRYAWALAKRGLYKDALKAASEIPQSIEERARALWRIAEVAREGQAVQEFQSIARSARLLNQQIDRESAPKKPGLRRTRQPLPNDQSWRAKSWLASVMLSVDSHEKARMLAEEVCEQSFTLSTEHSLAMPVSAMVKGRLDMPGAAGDRPRGLGWLLSFLWRPKLSASQRVAALLKRAKADVKQQEAYGLWLDALAESRFGGLGLVESVIAEGDSILSQGHHRMLASLRDETLGLDRKFSEQA
jgi:hypothetical protein